MCLWDRALSSSSALFFFSYVGAKLVSNRQCATSTGFEAGIKATIVDRTARYRGRRKANLLGVCLDFGYEFGIRHASYMDYCPLHVNGQ